MRGYGHGEAAHRSATLPIPHYSTPLPTPQTTLHATSLLITTPSSSPPSSNQPPSGHLTSRTFKLTQHHDAALRPEAGLELTRVRVAERANRLRHGGHSPPPLVFSSPSSHPPHPPHPSTHLLLPSSVQPLIHLPFPTQLHLYRVGAATPPLLSNLQSLPTSNFSQIQPRRIASHRIASHRISCPHHNGHSTTNKPNSSAIQEGRTWMQRWRPLGHATDTRYSTPLPTPQTTLHATSLLITTPSSSPPSSNQPPSGHLTSRTFKLTQHHDAALRPEAGLELTRVRVAERANRLRHGGHSSPPLVFSSPSSHPPHPPHPSTHLLLPSSVQPLIHLPFPTQLHLYRVGAATPPLLSNLQSLPTSNFSQIQPRRIASHRIASHRISCPHHNGHSTTNKPNSSAIQEGRTWMQRWRPLGHATDTRYSTPLPTPQTTLHATSLLITTSSSPPSSNQPPSGHLTSRTFKLTQHHDAALRPEAGLELTRVRVGGGQNAPLLTSSRLLEPFLSSTSSTSSIHAPTPPILSSAAHSPTIPHPTPPLPNRSATLPIPHYSTPLPTPQTTLHATSLLITTPSSSPPSSNQPPSGHLTSRTFKLTQHHDAALRPEAGLELTRVRVGGGQNAPLPTSSRLLEPFLSSTSSTSSIHAPTPPILGSAAHSPTIPHPTPPLPNRSATLPIPHYSTPLPTPQTTLHATSLLITTPSSSPPSSNQPPSGHLTSRTFKLTQHHDAALRPEAGLELTRVRVAERANRLRHGGHSPPPLVFSSPSSHPPHPLHPSTHLLLPSSVQPLIHLPFPTQLHLYRVGAATPPLLSNLQSLPTSNFSQIQPRRIASHRIASHRISCPHHNGHSTTNKPNSSAIQEGRTWMQRWRPLGHATDTPLLYSITHTTNNAACHFTPDNNIIITTILQPTTQWASHLTHFQINPTSRCRIEARGRTRAHTRACWWWSKCVTPSPPGGLEPPTFRLTAERANRLRHAGHSSPPLVFSSPSSHPPHPPHPSTHLLLPSSVQPLIHLPFPTQLHLYRVGAATPPLLSNLQSLPTSNFSQIQPRRIASHRIASHRINRSATLPIPHYSTPLPTPQTTLHATSLLITTSSSPPSSNQPPSGHLTSRTFKLTQHHDAALRPEAGLELTRVRVAERANRLRHGGHSSPPLVFSSPSSHPPHPPHPSTHLLLPSSVQPLIHLPFPTQLHLYRVGAATPPLLSNLQSLPTSNFSQIQPRRIASHRIASHRISCPHHNGHSTTNKPNSSAIQEGRTWMQRWRPLGHATDTPLLYSITHTTNNAACHFTPDNNIIITTILQPTTQWASHLTHFQINPTSRCRIEARGRTRAHTRACWWWSKCVTPSPPGGLEPPTFRLTAERANRLRHAGHSSPPLVFSSPSSHPPHPPHPSTHLLLPSSVQPLIHLPFPTQLHLYRVGAATPPLLSNLQSLPTSNFSQIQPRRIASHRIASHRINRSATLPIPHYSTPLPTPQTTLHATSLLITTSSSPPSSNQPPSGHLTSRTFKLTQHHDAALRPEAGLELTRVRVGGGQNAPLPTSSRLLEPFLSSTSSTSSIHAPTPPILGSAAHSPTIPHPTPPLPNRSATLPIPHYSTPLPTPQTTLHATSLLITTSSSPPSSNQPPSGHLTSRTFKLTQHHDAALRPEAGLELTRVRVGGGQNAPLPTSSRLLEPFLSSTSSTSSIHAPTPPILGSAAHSPTIPHPTPPLPNRSATLPIPHYSTPLPTPQTTLHATSLLITTPSSSPPSSNQPPSGHLTSRTFKLTQHHDAALRPEAGLELTRVRVGGGQNAPLLTSSRLLEPFLSSTSSTSSIHAPTPPILGSAAHSPTIPHPTPPLPNRSATLPIPHYSTPLPTPQTTLHATSLLITTPSSSPPSSNQPPSGHLTSRTFKLTQHHDAALRPEAGLELTRVRVGGGQNAPLPTSSRLLEPFLSSTSSTSSIHAPTPPILGSAAHSPTIPHPTPPLPNRSATLPIPHYSTPLPTPQTTLHATSLLITTPSSSPPSSNQPPSGHLTSRTFKLTQHHDAALRPEAGLELTRVRVGGGQNAPLLTSSRLLEPFLSSTSSTSSIHAPTPPILGSAAHSPTIPHPTPPLPNRSATLPIPHYSTPLPTPQTTLHATSLLITTPSSSPPSSNQPPSGHLTSRTFKLTQHHDAALRPEAGLELTRPFLSSTSSTSSIHAPTPPILGSAAHSPTIPHPTPPLPNRSATLPIPHYSTPLPTPQTTLHATSLLITTPSSSPPSSNQPPSGHLTSRTFKLTQHHDAALRPEAGLELTRVRVAERANRLRHGGHSSPPLVFSSPSSHPPHPPHPSTHLLLPSSVQPLIHLPFPTQLHLYRVGAATPPLLSNLQSLPTSNFSQIQPRRIASHRIASHRISCPHHNGHSTTNKPNSSAIQEGRTWMQRWRPLGHATDTPLLYSITHTTTTLHATSLLITTPSSSPPSSNQPPSGHLTSRTFKLTQHHDAALSPRQDSSSHACVLVVVKMRDAIAPGGLEPPTFRLTAERANRLPTEATPHLLSSSRALPLIHLIHLIHPRTYSSILGSAAHSPTIPHPTPPLPRRSCHTTTPL
ncbi:hypothetical protein Aperf_G00000030753 [Anoplocephala perfoliata]